MKAWTSLRNTFSAPQMHLKDPVAPYVPAIQSLAWVQTQCNPSTAFSSYGGAHAAAVAWAVRGLLVVLILCMSCLLERCHVAWQHRRWRGLGAQPGCASSGRWWCATSSRAAAAPSSRVRTRGTSARASTPAMVSPCPTQLAATVAIKKRGAEPWANLFLAATCVSWRGPEALLWLTGFAKDGALTLSVACGTLVKLSPPLQLAFK